MLSGVVRMNLNFRTLAALCSVAVSLNSGCNNIEDRSSQGTGAVSPLLSSDMQEAGIAPACAEDADFTPATHPGCTISFYEDSIGIRGEGAEVSGSSAVISTGGVYSVSGECSDGQLVIDCAEPVSLIVEGLTLSSVAGAVIECTEKATLLTLSISDENYISGEVGILSGADVTINGTGSLEISGENASFLTSLQISVHSFPSQWAYHHRSDNHRE